MRGSPTAELQEGLESEPVVEDLEINPAVFIDRIHLMEFKTLNVISEETSRSFMVSNE